MDTKIFIREKVRLFAEDMSVSKDFYDALDKKIIEIIQHAKIRAKANNRNTIMPRDI